MARRRFFVDSIRNGTAELRGEDARHLARVLRAEPGQRYEISDNRSAWLAEIAEAHGDRIVFRTLEPLADTPVPVQITLCTALIKFDHFEWMVGKATELGVERIVPVESARVEKGLREASRKRTERWTRIAREASQQSRRARAPEILAAVDFESALAGEADFRFFLDEDTAVPLLRLLPAARTAGASVTVVTGPEGGWTDPERAAAAARGWQAASLSPRILRAETAALAAAAILVNAWL